MTSSSVYSVCVLWQCPELGPELISFPSLQGLPLAKARRLSEHWIFLPRASLGQILKDLFCGPFYYFPRHALESNFSFLGQSKLLINQQVSFTQYHFWLHSPSVRSVLSVYWSIALLLIAFKKNSLWVVLILDCLSTKNS